VVGQAKGRAATAVTVTVVGETASAATRSAAAETGQGPKAVGAMDQASTATAG